MTINDLLQMAMEMGASDLHITVGIQPMSRINGKLVNLTEETLSAKDTELLTMGLVTEEQKLELKKVGQIDFSYALSGMGRFRVNVFRQRGSYAAAIRLINNKIPAAKELGISNAVIELTARKRGLVLVTGPTGSGKSTTLASLIDIINTNYSEHIITLEDPIEYLHAHKKSIINQREVGNDTDSYSNALRAALRQDPDVILVGEMRDFETISIAVTAAETGHLVFSTLHTIGAVNTIDRIIDVFPPHQQQQIRIQLAGVLQCVVSQQLIPRMDGKGRVAAFEVMLANPAIRNLIREAKAYQIASIMQTEKKSGMVTMDDSIYNLHSRYLIDAEQAVNYSQDPVSISKKILL